LEALVEYNQFEITQVQKKISHIVESQLFTPLCKANDISIVPDFKWYPLVTEDERQKAEVRHLDIDTLIELYKAELLSREIIIPEIERLFEGRLIKASGVADGKD